MARLIYPVSMVIDRSQAITLKTLLLNPVAQVIQDIRYALVDHQMPTLLSVSQNASLYLIPVGIVIVLFVTGAYYFRKNSPYFAENV